MKVAEGEKPLFHYVHNLLSPFCVPTLIYPLKTVRKGPEGKARSYLVPGMDPQDRKLSVEVNKGRQERKLDLSFLAWVSKESVPGPWVIKSKTYPF